MPVYAPVRRYNRVYAARLAKESTFLKNQSGLRPAVWTVSCNEVAVWQNTCAGRGFTAGNKLLSAKTSII